jgi:uncharacterized protein YbjT (DUF2867 family)
MILVVGGTGDLGGRVVRQLLARGLPVRCLVRPATSAEALDAAGVDVVRGDLVDPASLPAAVEGISTVVATATAIGRRLAGARRPTMRDVDEVGMSALVDAADRAGVARFVYVSYARRGDGLGTPLERAKHAVEARLGATSMRVVLVRPDAFQEIHLAAIGRFDVVRRKVAVVGKGDTKRRWVATEDVAALVAALVVEEDPPGVVEAGGPEALTRNEAIAVAERATGDRITVRRAPLGAARLLVRLLGDRQDALASVFGTGVMMDTTPADWDDGALRSRGIAARSATAWIESLASVPANGP